MPGALLMTHQDVSDLRVVQRIVSRQDRAAGNAEDHLDTDPLQGLDQCLCSGQLLW